MNNVTRALNYCDGKSITIDFRRSDPIIEEWFRMMIRGEIEDSVDNIGHGGNDAALQQYIEFLTNIDSALDSLD